MPPRKKKALPASVGLAANQVMSEAPPADVEALTNAIDADGGTVLARYREPYGASWVVMAVLPIDKVEATPYQRELSKTHADRLAVVIPKVGRFLDPIIAIRQGAGYWTPNGMHRLAAMRKLGCQAIPALVVPDPEVAYRILALNTEKAHNLKDKSLEVIRMARGLAADDATASRPESDWAFEFEEPAYLTVGMCYELRPRFSGGAYLPILKRTEELSDKPIGKSIAAREPRATRVLELDDAVNEAVQRLKDAGFTTGYLKPFVVARINPLRFVRAAKPGQKAPRAELDKTIDKMIDSAAKLDAKKVRPADLAAMAASGAPAED
jgi:ParB family transcriptional regulator, chromosome partitioning protein